MKESKRKFRGGTVGEKYRPETKEYSGKGRVEEKSTALEEKREDSRSEEELRRFIGPAGLPGRLGIGGRDLVLLEILG